MSLLNSSQYSVTEATTKLPNTEYSSSLVEHKHVLNRTGAGGDGCCQEKIFGKRKGEDGACRTNRMCKDIEAGNRYVFNNYEEFCFVEFYSVKGRNRFMLNSESFLIWIILGGSSCNILQH